MKRSMLRSGMLALVLTSGLCGCERKSGEAAVIGKDYVASVTPGEEIKDERATNHEQWIVEVRMLDNGGTVQVRSERAPWERLR